MPSERYMQLRKHGVKDMHNSDLLRACKEDNLVLEEFLQENKEFIFAIIIKYKGSLDALVRKFQVEEEEILQHAFIGVISSLRDFDFDRGVKFTTFVVRPILWEINQLLYNESQLVRLSRGAVDLLKRMKEVEDALGHLPTIEEISQILKVSDGRIREIMRFTKDFERIDAMVDFNIDDNLSKQREDDIIDKVYMEQMIEEAQLTKEELDIISLIMHDGLNNSQIAERLGKYPMTINRAIARIKEKLQNSGDLDKKSKYNDEIDLAASEMDELGYVIPIDDLQDLFEVCGMTSHYSPRILYYIRQKALQKVTVPLDSQREELA